MFTKEEAVGSSPCSHDIDVTVPPEAAGGVKASEFPVQELDKSNPKFWEGVSPATGDTRWWLTIKRSDVKRDDGDDDEGTE